MPRSESAASDKGTRRRALLGWLTAALGGAIGAALALPAAAYLTFPVRRRTVSDDGDAVDVGALESIPASAPLLAPVRVGRARDAWLALENVVLGAVWLRREGDQVTALSTVCPHAGCAVDWNREAGRFECPCHDSAFAPGGARLAGPAPRGLDALECVVERSRVRVRYRRFRPGVPDREPL